MKNLGTCLAMMMFSIFFGADVQAQSSVTIGTLTCSGGEGVGLVVGSKKDYSCQFVSANAASAQSYKAEVTRYGLDIGITGKSVVVWTVLATSTDTHEGMLGGTYSGPTADAAIVFGGGVKLLVGGSRNSIALQPLSVQGQTGVNIAVGIAEMTLR